VSGETIHNYPQLYAATVNDEYFTVRKRREEKKERE
jgi:hypothetical protein